MFLTRRSEFRGPLQHGFVWLLVFLWGLRAFGGTIEVAIVCFGFAAALASFSVLAGNAYFPFRPFLIGVYWLTAPLVLFLVLTIGAYLATGARLDGDALRAIGQTDPYEGFGFLARLFGWPEILKMLIGLAAVALTFPRPVIRMNRGSWIGLVLLGLGSTYSVALAFGPTFGPMLIQLREYKAEVEAFNGILASRSSDPVLGATSNFDGTLIVVLGESTSRHQMGAYGYFRSTTPNLGGLEREIVIFRDTISSHSHTVPALMAALTAKRVRQSQSDEKTLDIVSLAKAAGFKTAWLSNQNEYGIWDNPISAIGKSADESRFFSNAVGKRFDRSVYDHDMLEPLQQLLERSDGTRRRLVFVHLFASHWPYCQNHPPEFEVFSGQIGAEVLGKADSRSDLNCYDNSILYVDHFLGSVVRTIQKIPFPVSMLYVSDHGEAPLLGTGHESSRHSSYHIEVPMIFAANEAFKNANGDLVDAARSNAARPYSTSRLFHAVGDLLGISHQSVDRRNSPFSRQFVEEPRYALQGKIRYDEWSLENDYRENTRATAALWGVQRNRVWAHRTNSIGAMLEAKEVFSGIEMDVVWLDKVRCFHVFHPPAPDVGLSLEEMFRGSADRPALHFWLDWKNASADNIADAIACLDRLDRTYGIKDRVLVETGSDALFSAVSDISKKGYRHAYYLPTQEVLNCANSCTRTSVDELASKLQMIISRGRFDAVTYDWRLRSFVASNLDLFLAENSIKQYSWDLSTQADAGPEAALLVRSRFESAPIDALLVPFSSDFQN